MTSAVWGDPEFWGPVNPWKPGCWECIVHPPVMMLDHQRLCLVCLGRRFRGGWDLDRVLDWVERQVVRPRRERRAESGTQGRLL